MSKKTSVRKRTHGSLHPVGSALELKLAKEVIECDQERLRAQMSGLPTGWEHPNTQTYFKRVLRLAEMVLAQND